MHSSRMRTARCSGRLSCHAGPLPPCHACLPPPPCISPCHACPPAMHTLLPCTPYCHAHPLPCMPSCHTCPPTTHAPCHAHPHHTHILCHACPPPPCGQTHTCQGSHFSGLTKFPDFSLTFPVFFPIFQYFFNVLFFERYGLHLLLSDCITNIFTCNCL